MRKSRRSELWGPSPQEVQMWSALRERRKQIAAEIANIKDEIRLLESLAVHLDYAMHKSAVKAGAGNGLQ